MRDLYITITDGSVMIMDSDHDNILYRIRREELPLKMEDGTSEWIMQLMDKTWMDVGNLYRLAQYIKSEFPKNSIDWRKTFFIVEKGKYLDTLGEALIPKMESITSNVFEMIELGRKEFNAETHKIIDEIVTKRLNEFGL